jgi:hypothetical protein
MQIKVTSKGIPEMRAFLDRIQKGLKGMASQQVGIYLVGDSTHGLKHYPYYKYVNRPAGFPELGYTNSAGNWVQGYASEKQHHFVMAAIKDGRITPGVEKRGYESGLQGAWTLKTHGTAYTISNDKPYAGYVMGDQQTRMHKLIGWRNFREVIKTNLQGAFRYAQAEVAKWLKSQKVK